MTDILVCVPHNLILCQYFKTLDEISLLSLKPSAQLPLIINWQTPGFCRLGSHMSPTETVCYLTADLFYIEVVLLRGGRVEDVRVAHHGEAPEVRRRADNIVEKSLWHALTWFGCVCSPAHHSSSCWGESKCSLFQEKNVLKYIGVGVKWLWYSHRMKKFQEFSLKLDDLASFYNIPGDRYCPLVSDYD